MKIALIGATGFVGQEVAKEALNRGHEVTAISRNPENLEISDEKLSTRKVDVNDTEAVTEAVKGNDIVINTFNAGWTNPNLYDDFLNGSRSILEGVEKSGVKRFYTVGGAGSLYIEGNQLVDGPDFPEAIKPGARAARDFMEDVKKSDLDWTFLSPAIEMSPAGERGRRGTYRTGLENPVFDQDNRSFISVEDTAVAIVDEAEEGKHIRERYTIAY